VLKRQGLAEALLPAVIELVRDRDNLPLQVPLRSDVPVPDDVLGCWCPWGGAAGIMTLHARVWVSGGQETLGEELPRLVVALDDAMDPVNTGHLQEALLESVLTLSPPVQRAAATVLAALAHAVPPRRAAIVDALLETLTLRLCDVLEAVRDRTPTDDPVVARSSALAAALLAVRPAWPVPVLASTVLASPAAPMAPARAPVALEPEPDADGVIDLATTVDAGGRDAWSNTLQLQGLVGALRLLCSQAPPALWASLDAVHAVAATPTVRWADRFHALGWSMLVLAHAGEPNLVTASVELHPLLWRAAQSTTAFWERPLWWRIVQLVLARSAARPEAKPFMALVGLCLQSAAAAVADRFAWSRTLVRVPPKVAAVDVGTAHAAPISVLSALVHLDQPTADPLLRTQVATLAGAYVPAALRWATANAEDMEDAAVPELLTRLIALAHTDPLPSVRRRAVAALTACAPVVLVTARPPSRALGVVDALMHALEHDASVLVRTEAAVGLAAVPFRCVPFLHPLAGV
jgi:hypothetical protein